MEQLMICPKAVSGECDGKHVHIYQTSHPHKRCYPHQHQEDYCWKYNIGTYCPPCIPHRPFAVGGIVRVIKGRNFGAGFNDGEICKIKEKCGQNWRLISMSSGIDYFVKPDNMWSMYNEKEDAVPKYKLTTSLNMTKIYNDGNKDCIDFCNHFAQLIYSLRPSFLGDNLSKTALIEWAEQDPVRIKYMFDKVYIALNEPEVFYKRGDRFRHKRDGDECVIIQISAGNAQLLHIDSFNYWSGTANVKNIDKITQAEFAQIAGSCGPEGWEKI